MPGWCEDVLKPFSSEHTVNGGRRDIICTTYFAFITFPTRFENRFCYRLHNEFH